MTQSVILTQPVRVGGSVLDAGTTQTLADDIASDLLARGFATLFGTTHEISEASHKAVQLSAEYPGGIVAHAKAAAVAMKATGGIIQFPAGEHEVSGLPIFPGLTYRGVGFGGKQTGGTTTVTVLKLPAAPTTHMFVAKTAAQDAVYGTSELRIAGFAIENMELDGMQNRASLDASTGYDCINFDNLDGLTDGGVAYSYFRDLTATNFRCFYRNNCAIGNFRDRSPYFGDIQVIDCWAAVWTNEHPHFSGTSNFRACNYGVTGSSIYDMTITDVKFAYCDFGIAPQGSGTIGRSVISNCTFVYTGVGIVINNGSQANVISGNLFAPGPAPVAKCGISIATGPNDSASLISNNVFDEQGTTYVYTHAAVLLENTAAIVSNVAIDNNSFKVFGSKGIAAAAGVYDCSRCRISNNNFVLSGNPSQAINATNAPAIYWRVQGNQILVSVATGSTSVIDISRTASLGVVVSGNTCVAGATGQVDKFAVLAVARGIVDGNLCRNFTNGVQIVSVDSTSLPAGIAAATSSIATDSANLKTRNIIV